MTNKEKKHLQKVSKLLAQVLRHTPEQLDLTPDPEGWVMVDVLLAALADHDLKTSQDQLIEIVRTSDKKRFTLSEAGDQIRAAQGHSIAVDLGVAAIEPPALLFHGTAETTVSAIMSDGLHPMSRQQVHLSGDHQTALKVGARHGAPVILNVAAGDMHRTGHAFYQADNGVWLTDHVPAQYLKIEESADSSADEENTMKQNETQTETQTEITGETLKAWGHIPGKDFSRLLEIAQAGLAAGY
ncbi:MAG: RNA 2'-phosphotransferase, partial [Paracoccaceae bacterium]